MTIIPFGALISCHHLNTWFRFEITSCGKYDEGISGQMFQGRFNCAHGGASFDKVNIRCHFFIDPTRSSIRWRNLDTVYFGNGNNEVAWLSYDNYYGARKRTLAKTKQNQIEKKNRFIKAAATARGEVLK